MIPEERRYLPKPIRYYALPLICVGLVFNAGLKYLTTFYVDPTPPALVIVTTREKDKEGVPEGVHQYPSLVEQYEYKRSISAPAHHRPQSGLF